MQLSGKTYVALLPHAAKTSHAAKCLPNISCLCQEEPDFAVKLCVVIIQSTLATALPRCDRCGHHF